MSAAAEAGSGWQARLHLGFRRGAGRTLLAERHREGPLSVQRAFYPEGDLCHVYLLHPPGGVAGGDELDIRAHLAVDSNALVTTPGATKFYRSSGPRASQLQRLVVERGATLEWLPQENILFPGAELTLRTEVELTADARFIGWEINCLGRPVNGERFDHGSAEFRFRLLRDGLPIVIERQRIDAARGLDGAAGLRGQAVFATLYATHDDPTLLDELRELLPDTPSFGITLVDGLLIARYLGDSTEQCRNHFIALWRRLRPAVIGRDACAPRIWNT